MSAPGPYEATVQPQFDNAAFRATLVYERRATVAQLQEDLSAIRSLDVESQKLASRYGTRCALLAVGVIGCIVLTIVCAVNELAPLAAMFGGGAAVCLVFAIHAGIQYSHHSGTDVENRRYELASSLLHYLSADIRPATELELKIVFRHYKQSQYVTHKEGNSTAYQLPWLTLKGKFADGNRFDFSADLKVKRKEKPKRKYTKVKEDMSQDLTLEFTPRTPPADIALVNHLATIPPPPLGRYRAQAKDGKLTLRAVTGLERKLTGRGGTVTSNSFAPANMTELDQFLRLFLTAYHCWNTFPQPAK